MSTDVVIGVWTISLRLGIGQLDTYLRMVDVATLSGVHDIHAIDPGDSVNISVLLAFE